MTRLNFEYRATSRIELFAKIAVYVNSKSIDLLHYQYEVGTEFMLPEKLSVCAKLAQSTVKFLKTSPNFGFQTQVDRRT